MHMYSSGELRRRGLVQCRTCHVYFRRTDSKYKVYCSDECKERSIFLIKKHCVFCGKSFVIDLALGTSPSKKYCSAKCAALDPRTRRARTISVNPVFNRTVTKFAKNIFGDICMVCGWRETSNDLCHIIPWKKGGNNYSNNILILCPNHHRKMDRSLIPKEFLSSLQSRMPQKCQEWDDWLKNKSERLRPKDL